MTVPTGGTVNTALMKLPFRAIHIDGDAINYLDFLNFITQLASVTPNYSETSFTLTANGASGATGTCFGMIIGNIAILQISQILGTSSAATLTLTGLPSSFFPSGVSPSLPLMTTNGSVDGMGCARVGTTGIITVSSGVTRAGGFPSAWSATGSNGVIGGTIIYRLKG